jgi:hypothetical protein
MRQSFRDADQRLRLKLRGPLFCRPCQCCFFLSCLGLRFGDSAQASFAETAHAGFVVADVFCLVARFPECLAEGFGDAGSVSLVGLGLGDLG